MNGINWFKGGNTPSTGSGETRRSNALRVFIVVAALHAVVLGPILLFEGCKSGSTNTATNTENTDPVPPPQEIIAAPVQTVPPPPAMAPTAPVAPAAQLQPTPIPTPAPQPTVVTPPVAAKTYKVVAGDSLWKIAKTENVSIAELMRANNLTDKSVLRPGQTLQIPSTTAPSERTATTTAAPVPAGAQQYVVKAGDNLWEVARKHNTTVKALKSANNLTSDTLRVGQKLVIPAASAPAATPMGAATPVADPIAGGTIQEGDKTYHFVGFNEPLETIAKRYGVSQRAIIEANKIQNASAIRAGDKLLIPTKSQTPAPATPEAAVPPPPPLG
jgi:LysM repeat protein